MTIVIEQLGFFYNKLAVLREISAVVSPGKITAVLGPNAAGKTTLLRCIIGALTPKTGCVLVDGEAAHRLSPRKAAQRLAYVPQRSVVSAAFTVRQVVELGRYALPPSTGRVDDALEQQSQFPLVFGPQLDLTDIADRPYPALSVGQQQRVMLARAVAQMASDGHLVLDEPTSAMDLLHAAQCMRLLRTLADGGATVLLAMHDLSMAASIADEAWLLHAGRLAATGDVGRVLDVGVLQEIFGVRFEWVTMSDGRPRLLAHAPASQSAATMESA